MDSAASRAKRSREPRRAAPPALPAVDRTPEQRSCLSPRNRRSRKHPDNPGNRILTIPPTPDSRDIHREIHKTTHTAADSGWSRNMAPGPGERQNRIWKTRMRARYGKIRGRSSPVRPKSGSRQRERPNIRVRIPLRIGNLKIQKEQSRQTRRENRLRRGRRSRRRDRHHPAAHTREEPFQRKAAQLR